MTTNLTATFPNFIYSPTFLVKYFMPSSLQASNTSHFHMHSQLMALLPILLKEWKSQKRMQTPATTFTHPPASVLTLNYPSSYSELVLPIIPHPPKHIILAVLPLSPISSLFSTFNWITQIMLLFCPLIKSFSWLFLPSPANIFFSSCRPLHSVLSSICTLIPFVKTCALMQAAFTLSTFLSTTANSMSLDLQ